MFSPKNGLLARFKKDDSHLTTTGPYGGTTMAGTDGCWTLPTIDNATRRESPEELAALPDCPTALQTETTPLEFVRSSPVSELAQEHGTRHSLGPITVQQDSSLVCEQPARASMSLESARMRQ